MSPTRRGSIQRQGATKPKATLTVQQEVGKLRVKFKEINFLVVGDVGLLSLYQLLLPQVFSPLSSQNQNPLFSSLPLLPLPLQDSNLRSLCMSLLHEAGLVSAISLQCHSNGLLLNPAIGFKCHHDAQLPNAEGQQTNMQMPSLSIIFFETMTIRRRERHKICWFWRRRKEKKLGGNWFWEERREKTRGKRQW